MITVKFSTIANGVFIEVSSEKFSEFYKNCHIPESRCFRFDDKGNSEYALYGDLTSTNPNPRWYGHAYKKKDFIFT